MTTHVQMNTRIDGELKASGDAVFARIGYTPTRVVRCLWEYARNHANEPEVVKGVLEEMSGPAVDACAARAARRAKMNELDDMRHEMCSQLNIDPLTLGASTQSAVSNQQLRELSLRTRGKKYGVES